MASKKSSSNLAAQISENIRRGRYKNYRTPSEQRADLAAQVYKSVTGQDLPPIEERMRQLEEEEAKRKAEEEEKAAKGLSTSDSKNTADEKKESKHGFQLAFISPGTLKKAANVPKEKKKESFDKITKTIHDSDTDLGSTMRTGNYVGRSIDRGIWDTASSLTGFLDMITIPIDGGAAERLNSFVRGRQKQAGEKAYKASEAMGGGNYHLGSDLISMTTAAIPEAYMAYATAGQSLGASTLGKGLMKLPLASRVFQGMVKDPNFWMSFITIAGSEYNDAKEKGASDTQAALQGWGSGLIGAGIEIGGGIQTLAKSGTKAASKAGSKFGKLAKPLAKSAFEEGMEEVEQGLISRSFEKLLYNPDMELASFDNDNAVISGSSAAKEFAGGAAVGGILSGGHMAIGNMLNNQGMAEHIGRTIRETENINAMDIVNAGLAMPEKSKAYKNAKKIMTAKSFHDYDLGRQYILNADQYARTIVHRLAEQVNSMARDAATDKIGETMRTVKTKAKTTEQVVKAAEGITKSVDGQISKRFKSGTTSPDTLTNSTLVFLSDPNNVFDNDFVESHLYAVVDAISQNDSPAYRKLAREVSTNEYVPNRNELNTVIVEELKKAIYDGNSVYGDDSVFNSVTENAKAVIQRAVEINRNARNALYGTGNVETEQQYQAVMGGDFTPLGKVTPQMTNVLDEYAAKNGIATETDGETAEGTNIAAPAAETAAQTTRVTAAADGTGTVQMQPTQAQTTQIQSIQTQPIQSTQTTQTVRTVQNARPAQTVQTAQTETGNIYGEENPAISSAVQNIAARNNNEVYSDSIDTTDAAVKEFGADTENTETGGKKIGKNMSDDERFDILQNKTLTVSKYDKEKLKDISDTDERILNDKFKSGAKKVLKILAEEFDAFKGYSNSDIGLEFEYSRGSFTESINKQNKNYMNFAKMLTVFDDVIKNAIGIEVHDDRYKGTSREDIHNLNNYVLVSTFSDDGGIVPVRLLVKEFDDRTNSLRMIVSLNKIEDGISAQSPAVKSGEQIYAPPSHKISISDFFAKVKPEDGDFLKYVPDGFLNEKQKRAKQAAIEREEKYIERYKKRSLATAENDDALSSTPETTNSTASDTIIAEADENVNVSKESKPIQTPSETPKVAEQPAQTADIISQDGVDTDVAEQFADTVPVSYTINGDGNIEFDQVDFDLSSKTWRKGEYRIATQRTDEGDATVKGLIYGGYGISDKTVTHLQSGLSIPLNLYNTPHTLKNIKRFVEILSAYDYPSVFYENTGQDFRIANAEEVNSFVDKFRYKSLEQLEAEAIKDGKDLPEKATTVKDNINENEAPERKEAFTDQDNGFVIFNQSDIDYSNKKWRKGVFYACTTDSESKKIVAERRTGMIYGGYAAVNGEVYHLQAGIKLVLNEKLIPKNQTNAKKFIELISRLDYVDIHYSRDSSGRYYRRNFGNVVNFAKSINGKTLPELEEYINRVSADKKNTVDNSGKDDTINTSNENGGSESKSETRSRSFKGGGDSMWSKSRTPEDARKKAVPIKDIVRYIEKTFGIPISSGNLRGKFRRGVFRELPETIRTKITNDLPVIAHELGHALDKKYNLSSNENISEVRDWVNRDNPDFLEQYSEDEQPGETVAEFIRQMFKDRTAAERQMPKFYKAFTDTLNEKDLSAVNQAVEMSNRYFSADFSQRAESAITTRDEMKKENRPSVRERTRKAYAAVVDTFSPIKSVVDFVERTKGPVRGSENAYRLALNSKSASAVVDSLLNDGFIDEKGNKVGDGFIDCLVNVQTKHIKKFSLYLVYRHALDWLDPNEGGTLKRVFADDELNNRDNIENAIADMEAEHPEFKDAAESLYTFQRSVLKKYLVDTGIMTKELFDKLQKLYPNYVPFYRNVGKQHYTGAKSGFANQHLPLMRAKGSGAEIINPLESIITNTEKIVKTAQRNQVMQVLTSYADNVEGFGRFMEQVPPDSIRHYVNTTDKVEKLKDIMGDKLGAADFDALSEALDDIIGDSITEFTPVANTKKQIVTVIRNGKSEYYQIHDEDLFKAVSEITPAQLGMGLRTIGRATSLTNTLITSHNIVFCARNILRDFKTGLMHTNVYKSWNPIVDLALWSKAYATAFVHILTQSPEYKLYKSQGGGHQSNYNANINELARALRRLSAKDMGKAKRLVYSIFRHPIMSLVALNEATEAIPRLAEFEGMLKKTGDAADAMYAANDITVNFARSGKAGRSINQLFRFSNAQMQGLDKEVRMFTEGSKKDVAQHIFRYAVFNALMVAVVQAIARAVDPEGWDELSKYKKNNYWCFATGNGHFIELPKAREVNIVGSLMERIYDGASGDEEAFYQFGEYLTDTLVPSWLPTDLLKGDIKGAVNQVGGATVFGGLVENALNEDYKGTPIIPEYLSFKPNKEQETANTSWLAHQMGQWFNVSPMKVDHFLGELGVIGKAVTSIKADPKRSDLSFGFRSAFTADSRYSTDVFNRAYERRNTLMHQYMNNPTAKNASKYEKYAMAAEFISQAKSAVRTEGLSGEAEREALRKIMPVVKTLSVWNDTDKALMASFDEKDTGVDFGKTNYVGSEINRSDAVPSAKLSKTKNKVEKSYTMTVDEYIGYVEDYTGRLNKSRQKLLKNREYQKANTADKSVMLNDAQSEVARDIEEDYKRKFARKFK